MNRFRIAFAVAITSLVTMPTHAKPSYNPTQLDQFNATNRCVGCDLSGAVLTRNHSGAILDNANLSSIDSHDSTNNGINLSAASLRNVDLSGSDLNSANFSEADLTGASFYGASLRWANFYGAKGVNLTGAKNTCYAVLPDGKFNVCDDTPPTPTHAKVVKLPFENEVIVSSDHEGLFFDYDMNTNDSHKNKVVCEYKNVYKSWTLFRLNGQLTEAGVWGGSGFFVLTSKDFQDNEDQTQSKVDVQGSAKIMSISHKHYPNQTASCRYEFDDNPLKKA